MNITKPIAVYVDRLEAALAAKGIDMRRTNVLEIAAAVLGYHNTHECTAASKRGDLTPPKAEPVCRVEIPGGEALIVLRDPISDAPYAIDETFLEQVVEEERREAYGPSPYGRLLDLSEVAIHPATAWCSTSNSAAPVQPVALVGLDASTVAYAIAHRYKGQPIATDKALMVRCPVHDDANPSLAISGDADGLVMRCMAGCDHDAVQEAVLDILCDRKPDDGTPQDWIDVFDVNATCDGETYRERVGVKEGEDIEVKARRLIATEFRITFDETAKWSEDDYEFDGELDTISIEYAELEPQVAALVVTIRKAMQRMGKDDPLRDRLERDLREIMPKPTVTDKTDD